MIVFPRIVLSVQTPYTQVSQATLTSETWEKKILVAHPEMVNRLPDIELTLKNPSVICEGTTNSKNVVFVNKLTTSPSGSPLAVYVRTDDGLVRSASFRQDFKFENRGPVLWLPPSR